MNAKSIKDYFIGRLDVYAVQTDSGAYNPVREKITGDLVKEHLDGKITLGTYLVLPDDTTKHTVIDVDDLDYSKTQAVIDAATAMGLPEHALIIEFSGRKGYHVWLRYENAVPAANARKLGRLIVAKAGLKDTEVFPKQDKVSDTKERLGNLVKLPLGYHKQSQAFSKLIAPEEVGDIKLVTDYQLESILKDSKWHELDRSPERMDERIKSGLLPCIERMLDGVGEGNRDNSLFHLILHYRRHGVSMEGIISELQQWDKKNSPPLGTDVVVEKVRTLWDKPYRGVGCDREEVNRYCNRDACPLAIRARARIIESAPTKTKAAQKNLLDILPKEGFLADYVRFAGSCTDAPDIFHVFAGLNVITTALGNKVKMPWGNQSLYTNLWTILIAGSSTQRKTAALNIAEDILRRSDTDLCLPTTFSPERLYTLLANNAVGCFFWSEMKAALAMMEKDYMRQTKEDLTNFYDCPDYIKRELQDKGFIIRNPFIGILAATTLDWLIEGVKAGDITGGFLARFLFVQVAEKTKDYPIPPMADPYEREKLVAQVTRLRAIHGTVAFHEVTKMQAEWYTAVTEAARRHEKADIIQPFISRLTTSVWKIAIALEAARSGELFLKPDTMQCALNIADFLRDSITDLLEREFHLTRDAAELERLYKLVERRPGKSRRDLLRASNLRKFTFDQLLDTLMDSGRIVIEQNKLYTDLCDAERSGDDGEAKADADAGTAVS